MAAENVKLILALVMVSASRLALQGCVVDVWGLRHKPLDSLDSLYGSLLPSLPIQLSPLCFLVLRTVDPHHY
jgi:hypothetical protein